MGSCKFSLRGQSSTFIQEGKTFTIKQKSTNIHWVWGFITKCEVNLLVGSFVSKADETWKFQKGLALQFWNDSNFKFKMKLGDVKLLQWLMLQKKCCDLCTHLLPFVFTRFHFTFLVITDPTCTGNNFPFELLQYSLFLSSFRAALGTNAQIYHTFSHFSPLEFQLMDH